MEDLNTERHTLSSLSPLYQFSQIEPTYNMVFSNGDKEVARLEWGTGKLVYSGEMDESAKLFFDFIKPYLDEYMEKNK
jgi:hypothetical protein